MPSLNDVLGGLPPVYGAYAAARGLAEQGGMRDLGMASTLVNLQSVLQQQAQREMALKKAREYEAGLRPDMTLEQQIAHAARYSGPEKVLDVGTKHLDREAQIKATAEAKRASLAQQQSNAEMMHELRLGQIGNVQDESARKRLADAERERHNRVVETFAAQNAAMNAELKKLGIGLQQQGLELKRDQLAQAKAQEDNRPLPGPLQKSLTEAAEMADATTRFSTTFKDEYGNKTIIGGLGNVYGKYMGDDTGQAQWWQDYSLHESQVRNKLFGSALTSTEMAAWQKSAISPRMDSGEIKKNLARREKLEKLGLDRLMKGAAAGRYSKEQIEAFTGRPVPATTPSGDGNWKDL